MNNLTEFTFAIITYNHENYILDHLESIKFQVLNYGMNSKIYLNIHDDNSADKTIKIINHWLIINKEIFTSVCIIENEYNLGIVKNYIACLKKISTVYYKILAGDDLYNQYDVINIRYRGMLISPLLKFEDNLIISKKSDYYDFIFIRNLNKSKLFLLQSFGNFISAPSVFLTKDLIKHDFYLKMQNYHWIEDIPMWNYILSLKTLNIDFFDKPLILYRIDSGISKNKDHQKNSEFELELRNIRKKFHNGKFNKLFIFIYTKYVIFFKVYFIKDYNNLLKNFLNEAEISNSYLNEIKMKSKLFLSRIKHEN